MSEQRWAELGGAARDRWVVVRRRQGDPRVSPLWPGWSAWCELGGRGGIVTQIKSFDTHAEALAYADRRARTVTVTLPRVGRQSQIPVPEDYGNDRPISVSNHGSFIGVAFTTHGLKQDVAIHPDELEPLALALLAHARRG